VSTIERTEAAPVDLQAVHPRIRPATTAGRVLVRRPADAVALAAATILLIVLAGRAGTMTTVDESLVGLIGSIPAGLRALFVDIYRLGSLWMVAVVAGVALWRKYTALAVTVTASGLLSWIVAPLLRAWIDSGPAAAFPLGRIAVFTAAVTVTVPYLARPWRMVSVVTLAGLAVSAVYLGAGLPLDVAGGAVVGFAVAKAVQLVVGGPANRPTTTEVRAALARLAVDVVDVVEADSKWTIAAEMVATTPDDRRLLVRVLGRDQRDLSLIAKSWRWLNQKDYEPNFFVTRVSEVEHEAYVMLLARRAGAPVPDVVAAGRAGENAALLIEEYSEGRPVDRLAPQEITERLIAEMWAALAKLRDARIAHGALSADRFVARADGGVWLTDFSTATASATSDRLDRDVADLLATTAVLVGPERAVAAARHALGADGLRASLPYVQTVVISVPTRRAIPKRSKLLDRVRDAGAASLGEKAPERVQVRRVTSKDILMAAGTFLGINALLAQIGSLSDIGDALAHANWWWVLLAFTFTLLTYPAVAVNLMASLPNRLPFARVTELQLACKFTNLMAPADMGSQAVTIRFLQNQGVDAAAAVTSNAATSLLGAVSDLTLVFIGVQAGGFALDTGGLPDGLGRTILIVLATVVVASIVVFRVPKLRDWARPHLRQAWATLKGLFTSPRRTLVVLLSGAGSTLLFTMCLSACLEAFGMHLPLATLLVVNWSASTVANLTPVPGGMGVTEAGLIAGLAAAGIPPDQAVAATMTHRFLTFWIPPIGGWFALRDLTESKYV
jgi:uncharacterized membrane protein YbhN (UPF0104 family)/membrane-associated phospholipid phosphatase/tRNA A-37 threonylcarbamoyl transferase component Bud32